MTMPEIADQRKAIAGNPAALNGGAATTFKEQVAELRRSEQPAPEAQPEASPAPAVNEDVRSSFASFRAAAAANTKRRNEGQEVPAAFIRQDVPVVAPSGSPEPTPEPKAEPVIPELGPDGLIEISVCVWGGRRSLRVTPAQREQLGDISPLWTTSNQRVLLEQWGYHLNEDIPAPTPHASPEPRAQQQPQQQPEPRPEPEPEPQALVEPQAAVEQPPQEIPEQMVTWTKLWWGRCKRIKSTPQGQMKLMALILAHMAKLPAPYEWTTREVNDVATLTGLDGSDLLTQINNNLKRGQKKLRQLNERKYKAALRKGIEFKPLNANLKVAGIPDLYLVQVLVRNNKEWEVRASYPGDTSVRRFQVKELAIVLAIITRELRRGQGQTRKSRSYILEAVKKDFKKLNRKIDPQKLRRILQQLERMGFIKLNNTKATKADGRHIATLFTFGEKPATMPWWLVPA